MRVAVVGAGVSGLPAIKCCLDEGLDVVCFERRNDLGGLWNYSETVEPGLSNVTRYEITTSITVDNTKWQTRWFLSRSAMMSARLSQASNLRIMPFSPYGSPRILVFAPMRKRGLCRRAVSVCLSVCVSVTFGYSDEASKPRLYWWKIVTRFTGRGNIGVKTCFAHSRKTMPRIKITAANMSMMCLFTCLRTVVSIK